MHDIDRDLDEYVFWVTCNKCGHDIEPTTDRGTAIGEWNGVVADDPPAPVTSPAPISTEAQFHQELIDVLQNISKSLRTLATKR